MKNIKNVIIVGVIGGTLATSTVCAQNMDQFHFQVDSNKTFKDYLDTIELNDKNYVDMAGKYNYYLRFQYIFPDKIEDGYFNKLVDNFKSTGNTNKEKFNSVMKYMSNLKLTYAMNPGPEDNYTQIKSLKNGRAMCQGATILAAKLMDKTGIEYRYVLEEYIHDNTLEVGTIGGHTYLEIKTDNGKWFKFNCTDPIHIKNQSKLLGKYNKAWDNASKRSEPEILNRTHHLKKINGQHIEYLVSPIYKNGKKLDNMFKSYIDK